MKNFAKLIAKQTAFLISLPLVLGYKLTCLILDTRRAFRPYSEFLSLLPGISGQYIRRAFYQSTLDECSDSCHIGFGTLLSTTDIRIGDEVYIGSQCSLGSIHIGRDSLFASGVRTISGLKQHGIDELETPIRQQLGEFNTIVIGEDCWIGEGALLAANVGAHSIVAAGSVVIDDVPEYSIVGGNPAKLIRSRKTLTKRGQN